MTATDAAQSRSRRGRVLTGILISIVVLLIGAVALIETAGRAVAQQIAADRIEQRLPPGSGDAEVTLPGSVTLQLLSGEFERVDAELHAVPIDEQSPNATVDVTLTAFDVPLDGAVPARRVNGVITIDNTALPALLRSAFPEVDGLADSLTLESGLIRYETEVRVLGSALGVAVEAQPELTNGRVKLQPIRIEALDTGFAVEVEEFVDPARLAFGFCVAQYLPAGLELTGVDVRGNTALVWFTADGNALASNADERGHC
ncbi:LmeA family phospholipid-binding protein [Ruicaihuangia caeni]|uniref:LmeA family phospholipid-binding protein n=1 Tax=Ruicaihuangia caeni TaxID=3042517 RepID=UPI00338E182D